MILTDTHTHLYLDEFSNDRDRVIEKALENGISRFFLPNIDSASVEPILSLSTRYPGKCFPMIGLHPCSVKANYKDELKLLETHLIENKFYAVGEIGIDLYWDKTFVKEQKDALRIQVQWAKEMGLPVVIHSRNSFNEIVTILEPMKDEKLSGVFHCFSGSVEDAGKAIALGFYLGIGGVVTFKNGGLDKVLPGVDIKNILLETDSPYLAPVPYRGKRNESSYLSLIAEKVAGLYGISVEETAEVTTHNSKILFRI